MASTQAQPSAYTTALGKLQPLVPILAGFNHRNKNQHRHARWWAAFNSLRRNVARLISELEVSARKAGKSGKKRKHEEKGKDGVQGGATEERARWMRDYGAPEAYLTFSQLAADNQFAVLGIVLLGVLASVHSACVQLVGEPEHEVVEEEEKEVVVAASADIRDIPAVVAPPKSAVKSRGKGLQVADDFGQVVSREEVAAAAAAAAPTVTAHETSEEPPVKRKKKDAGEPSLKKPTDNGSDSARKLTKKPDQVVKEKKKKKKKSKGDEFDALFSSLV